MTRSTSQQLIGIAGLVGLATITSGCGDVLEDGKKETRTEQPAGAQTGPGAFNPEFRTSDQFITKMKDLEPGTSPHGRTQIWYSRNIEPLISSPSFLAPVGTVAIKLYNTTGNPGADGIAFMVKKPAGFDPAHNDWYYDMRGLDGNVMSEPAPGANVMCSGCHGSHSATDYLAGVSLTSPL